MPTLTNVQLEFVRTAITAFSAAVALASAMIAARAQLSQRRLARSERRFVAYRLVLLEPARTVLTKFQVDALAALGKGQDDISKLEQQDVQVSLLKTRGRDLVGEFNARYHSASGELLDAAEAWGDPQLTSVLRDQFTDLQDDITLCCETLPMGEPISPPIDLRLRQQLARILATLVRYEVDPPPQRIRNFVRRTRVRLPRWLGGITPSLPGSLTE